MEIFKGKPVNQSCCSNDVSTDEMASIIDLHTWMIKTLASGDSLQTTIQALTLKLEEHFQRKTHCSLLMVNEENRLTVEYAPTLPQAYQQAIHLIEAGPKIGSCGTAAFRKETVISSDIGNDPLWEDYREDALHFGLKACWSSPILVENQVVGTFAVYHSDICTPAAHEIEMLETCASLAGLAIERDRRIKLERQLQESEQRFKSLFDYYPDSAYIFSLEGHFLDFNQESEPLSGYRKEELLGKSFLPFIASQDRERVWGHFNEAKKGSVQHYECRVEHRKGNQLIVSLTNVPIMVNGEVVGVYGIGRDVTRERELEDELITTHQEMEHLFKNHSGLIFKYKKENGQFIHTFGEGQLLKRMGLKIEEAIGKTLYDFFPAELAAKKEKIYQIGWEGKEAAYEVGIHDIHYRAMLNPVFKDGQVVEVIVTCNDITELKKAHEELRETKELLESFINNTADAIVTVNDHGQITYVNEAYVDLFGWWEDELLGKEILNVPNHCKETFARLTELTFSEKKVNQFETERLSKDGRIIPVSVTQSPLKDKSGTVTGASAIIRDISEQKRTERELEENKQRYQSLFYCNPDLVYSMDVNGALLNTNLSFHRVLGYTPEQVKGMSWEKFIKERSFNETEKYFERALQGTPQSYETVGIHQNGQEVMAHVTNMPIMVDGQIVGVYGIVKDITEQKKAQQEILSLKQQMELVLDSIGDGIYAMNENWEITLINPAGAKMLGYDVGELLGKTPKDTFKHLYDLECCMSYQTLLDGKNRHVTDELFFRKDGTSFPVDYICSPILENGEIRGVVVAFRDISEKKMAEEYLLKSAKLEMAGQLAAGVAHEIRNPLTCIQGFIRLLEETDKREPEYFSIIRSEFERIEGIISEFLALAKPQALNFQKNDIELILMQTIHLMNAQAIMHNVEIVTVIEEGLPLFQSDKHQLKQVFINVIKNAIEATASQGTLTITCKKTRSHLHIEFQDQGEGISPERIKHLFEPFYSTKEKGTGLGLMVSYKIIEEHKGMMRVESEEGKGTTVHILLPLASRLL
ncbi:PAS domain S-box protein [Domibacillus indicus]|uniref:PAS domain S-box protein n=1 Tax=Domibacillus indicus TaxID=1437523 RepID=UPI002040FDCE|nr:PAS domain S-box protein [Domibacillus indicus]MCM3788713.1 PAS domain S-box protein [Domibacillus indicus]